MTAKRWKFLGWLFTKGLYGSACITVFLLMIIVLLQEQMPVWLGIAFLCSTVITGGIVVLREEVGSYLERKFWREEQRKYNY